MYLTLSETGERLGRGRLAVMRLISTGALKATKEGPYRNSPYRVEETDLADFLRLYPTYAESAAQS